MTFDDGTIDRMKLLFNRLLLASGTSIARQSMVEAIVSNISLTWHLMTTSKLMKESRLTIAFAKRRVLIFMSTPAKLY